MSRKRIQTQLDENRAWYSRLQRERSAAMMRALAQQRPIPGYRRVDLEEEIDRREVPGA